MTEEIETSPGFDNESQEVEITEELQDAELEVDEDSGEEQTEPTEEESEELDFNQQTYKLPKSIAAAVKDMQKDYTSKTQAVAEQRKTFESEVQFRQQHIDDIADLKGLDKQIGQYKNLDWVTLNQNDPVMFQQLRLQYDEIKEARQQLASTLAQKHQEVTLQNQQEIARKMQESESVLRREIKDWSPNKEAELQSFAAKQYGFDADDVAKAKVNPALYKLLNDAYIGQQLLKKQTSKPVGATKKAEPVPILSASKSSHSKSPDNMTDAEFAKWRAGQIKRRR